MYKFSDRLTEALSIRKVSAAELARRIGVNEGTISNYKSGRYSPKQERIEEIANALNVSIAWIMGADVPVNPNCTLVGIPSGFQPVPAMKRVPRLGRISCGEPIMSDENFDGFDTVPENINCDFTLVCEGDSMIGARILDGDVVYIKQQPVVDSGAIAAVLIDGTEKLLKRVYITESSVTLQAENPKYAPLVFVGAEMNRVTIIGKAVGFYSTIK